MPILIDTVTVKLFKCARTKRSIRHSSVCGQLSGTQLIMFRKERGFARYISSLQEDFELCPIGAFALEQMLANDG